MSVEMDVPTTAVAGVPTEPVPWRARGSVSLRWATAPGLQEALIAEGATTLSGSASVRVYLGGDRVREFVDVEVTGTAPIGADSVSLSASGQFPPMVFASPGAGNPMLVTPGGVGSGITPLKADGTPTSVGTVGFWCMVTPILETWHRVDVLPAPTSAEHGVSGQARLAGADVDLGAGTLALTETADKAVTGSLALPATGTASLRLLGIIPAAARVRVVPGPITGTLASGLSTQATVQVSELSVLGVRVVGEKTPCTSTTTIALSAAEAFTVQAGGTLTGTFDVGAFTGCGAFRPVVDHLLAKPGNTITITTG
ncbi:hypothetical protein [Actinokineospora bangkokensis]|uniref:Htaa domain-containing protein n=1 Tax=Actinokineospora bangkokensis TaxID=1193682 RepID=A0A1Q9LRY3_9PSEU|nr:hypothetical protein [Actinokineospora bangkokensis]OLR94795.1 hypothetical protein BJP25_09170 [Actinokineospora bangkokensis]